MIVRPLEPHQHEVAARLWFESLRASNVPAPPDSATEAQLLGRLRSQTEWTCLLAWDGGAAVGFLALEVQAGWLRQLFVAPEQQGRGVGTRLLEEARRAMPTGFRLKADAENTEAIGFYERRGLDLVETGIGRFGRPVAFYAWRPETGG